MARGLPYTKISHLARESDRVGLHVDEYYIYGDYPVFGSSSRKSQRGDKIFSSKVAVLQRGWSQQSL